MATREKSDQRRDYPSEPIKDKLVVAAIFRGWGEWSTICRLMATSVE
jgi:hypothetical protein